MIKGCAHITGGGFQENVDRILPQNCDAQINTKTWEPDAIFTFLQENGNVENDEMYRTFNMGIGMALVLDRNEILKTKDHLLKKHGLKSWVIGEIIRGKKKVEVV